MPGFLANSQSRKNAASVLSKYGWWRVVLVVMACGAFGFAAQPASTKKQTRVRHHAGILTLAHFCFGLSFASPGFLFPPSWFFFFRCRVLG